MSTSRIAGVNCLWRLSSARIGVNGPKRRRRPVDVTPVLSAPGRGHPATADAFSDRECQVGAVFAVNRQMKRAVANPCYRLVG
jgi:hypothetical protein